MQHRLEVALEDGSLAHRPEVPCPDAQRCRVRAAVEERIDRPLRGAPDAPEPPRGRDSVEFGSVLVCGENGYVEKFTQRPERNVRPRMRSEQEHVVKSARR